MIPRIAPKLVWASLVAPVPQDLRAGKYDALFLDAPEKPSDLYRATQNHAPLVPTVHLLKSEPVAPEVFVRPMYPADALLAQAQGTVALTIDVDSAGRAINLTFEKGAPIFQEAVKSVSDQWKFPPNLIIPWIRVPPK